MHQPISIKEYNIYDVFYNGEEIIIILPFHMNHVKCSMYDGDDIIDFICDVCPHIRTIVYHRKIKIYKSTVTLILNGKQIHTNINMYPFYHDKIIMSAMVFNEDNYIVQWIEHHLMLGVSNFIIYDNSNFYDGISYHSVETKSNLEYTLKKFIIDGTVCLINWPYPKRIKSSGITGQTTQENHSVYAFRSSKYIGFFDIDEYVNPQKEYILIDDLFNDEIKFNKLNVNEIGSFKLWCKLFFNPNKKSTGGHDFLQIYDCTDFAKGREKHFVIPKNIKLFNIHTISLGKPSHTIDYSMIYFNHYYFLNKEDRGMCKTDIVDLSIGKFYNF